MASRYTPLKFIEMGKNVFESAIVSSCLLFVSARKNTTLAAFDAVDIDRLTDNKFPPQSDLWKQVRPNGELPWSILSKVGQRIIDKIQDAGTLLKDWEVQITRGVTTGCNDVFVINSATKDTLISTHTKSAEIIKPVLRGKDIQRFQIQWKDLWLVYTRKGIEINDYPAVQEYLSEHIMNFQKKPDRINGMSYKEAQVLYWIHNFHKKSYFGLNWLKLEGLLILLMKCSVLIRRMC